MLVYQRVYIYIWVLIVPLFSQMIVGYHTFWKLGRARARRILSSMCCGELRATQGGSHVEIDGNTRGSPTIWGGMSVTKISGVYHAKGDISLERMMRTNRNWRCLLVDQTYRLRFPSLDEGNPTVDGILVYLAHQETFNLASAPWLTMLVMSMSVLSPEGIHIHLWKGTSNKATVDSMMATMPIWPLLDNIPHHAISTDAVAPGTDIFVKSKISKLDSGVETHKKSQVGGQIHV